MKLQKNNPISYSLAKVPDPWVRIIGVILIIITGFLVYGGSLHSEFHLDDESTVTANRDIRSIKSAILSGSPRFITNLTFAINYHFCELDTFGYNLTNLIIHIISGILVFFVIELTLKLPLLKERFGGYALDIGLLAALIFTVHPVQTGAVTYITQRMESQSSMFYLAALLFFILSVCRPGHKISLTLAAVISSFLAMGSKQIATTIPVLILVYDFMLISGGDLNELKKRRLSHILISSTLILPAYLTITNLDVYGKTSGFGIPYVSPLNYLFTQFSVVLYYIKLIFLPYPLNLDYDWRYAQGLFEFPTFLSFLTLVGVAIMTLKIAKRRPLYAFLIIWYFLILAPSSSIIPLKDAIFEHRVYLASVGIIWLSLLGTVPLLGSKTSIFGLMPVRYLHTTLICIVILVFGLLTIQRNMAWETEITLWEDTVNKSPNKSRPHLNLGTAYKRAGLIRKAIAEYKESFRVDPSYGRGQSNLGVAYYEMGRVDEAIKEIKQAMEKSPGLPEIHYNLGIIYREQKDLYEAIQSYKRAIELDPEYEDAYFNLGEIYIETERIDEAISLYEKLVSMKPYLASAHANLGGLYSQKGDFAKAEKELKKAVRLKPDEFIPHYNLAATYESLGRVKEAINEYRIARDLKPDFPEARNGLANLYKQLGLFDEAIEEYQILTSINPQDRQNRANLLLTRNKKSRWNRIAGKFQESIKTNPNDEKAYVSFGEACMKLGVLITAKEIFDKLLQINPNSYEARLNLGIILGRKEKYEKSVQELKKAQSINPKDVRSYYNLGVTYEKLSMPSKAIEQYQQATKLQPGHEGARINLAVLLAKEKRVREAILELKEALKVNPLSEEAHINLGILHKKEGKLTEAETKLKKAVELNPSNAQAHYHLALVYLKQEKTDQANQEYQTLKKINPILAEKLIESGLKPLSE